MAYLRDHGIAVVPLQQLVEALEGRAAMREPAVVITFDDGWEGQYRHALPILQRFRYTATFFIITDAVGKVGEPRQYADYQDHDRTTIQSNPLTNLGHPHAPCHHHTGHDHGHRSR